MIYETLDVIPINRFVDMYLGNYSVLVISGCHSNEELEKKAAELIYDYSMIVKGKRQMVELYHKDEILCLQGKICLLQACANLLALDGNKGMVMDALIMLGYDANENNAEMKARQVLGKLQFQLDMHQKEGLTDEEKSTEQADRGYFTKEMAMVMKYNKFTFNAQEVSAAMYAYWLKDMIDYFNTMNKNAK